MPNNKFLEVSSPISLFLKTGKQKLLAAELINSNEKEKLRVMDDLAISCALGVESGEMAPHIAAKRIGIMIGLDDSEDHDLVCRALEGADSLLPQAVERIVSSLPASKLLQLDPTTGSSAELLIDYATAGQLATLARYYTGKIFAAQTREIRFPDRDSMRLRSSRANDAARGLGRLLDLVVDREDTGGDAGFLELFAAALLGDEPVSLIGKTGKSTEPSFMIGQIIDMANKRTSAARVIESLPSGNPMSWKAKMALVQTDNDLG